MPTTISNNQQFLEYVFGTDWSQVEVCSVPVLGDDNYRIYWNTDRAGSYLAAMDPAWNNYFCVSLMDTSGVRRKVNFKEWRVLVVDDVGPKVDPTKVLDLLGEPTYRIETSPDNQHWGYVIDPPVKDATQARDLIWRTVIALVGPTGKDPGMKGVTRVMRLPFASNTKYDPPHKCRLISTEPRRLDPAHLDKILPGLPGKNSPGNPQPAEDLDPFDPFDAQGMNSPGPAPAVPGPGPAKLVPSPVDPTLRAMRRLGMVLGNERKTSQGTGWDVRCPWVHEHTPGGGVDTGTVYFRGGGFKCWHGHCDARTPEDVRRRMNEILAEETGGLFSLDDFDPNRFGVVDPAKVPQSPLGAAGPEPADMAEFRADTIYNATEDRFLSLRSDQVVYNDKALDTVWLERLSPYLPMDAKGRIVSPSRYYRSSGNRMQIVQGRTWWPGQPRLFTGPDGTRYINRWRDLDRPLRHVPDQDLITLVFHEWMELQRELFGAGQGDAEADANLEHFLDHQSMIVAVVDLKPGHNLLMIGKQGAGKELVLKAVRDVLGPDRHIGINETIMRDSHATWQMHRLVTMPEVSRYHNGRRTDHDQYLKIKELCDPGKPFMSINQKYQTPTQVRNVFVLTMTSNDDRPLTLPADDRRIWVVRARDPGWPVARYQQLAWSLEEPFANVPGATQSHAIVEWLIRRWDRSAMLGRMTGHAPMTRDKQDLIRRSSSELDLWVEELLDRRPPDAWTVPDVFTAQDIMRRIENAAEAGGLGLARGTRVNGANSVGRILGRLGCVKLNREQAVPMPDGPERHVWCRSGDAGIYVTMSEGELRDWLDAPRRT